MPFVEVLCWSDYLCPWCYVGLDRSALLRAGGLQVVTLPFELHPEIPPGGHERSRSVGRWSLIAEECAAAGLPWDPQPRSPNTRRVLELSEWVRRVAGAEVHVAFEALVFRAHFAEQLRIDDAGVQAELLARAGVDAAEAFAAASSGEPATWVDESMALAREVGVGGTPAWLFLGDAAARRGSDGPVDGAGGADAGGGGFGDGFDDGFFVPGVHPRPFYERLAARFTAALE